MKNAWLVAGCAVTAVIAALQCAAPKHQIMPGYTKLEVSADTLGVILIKRNLSVADPVDLASVLGGGDAVTLVYHFFGNEFSRVLGDRSGFKRVVFLPGGDDNLRGGGDGTVNYGGGFVSLPTGRHYISRAYRYLLILDRCSFGRDQYDGASLLGAEGGFIGLGGGIDNARLSVSFVVWDNTKTTVVAYGTINEKIPTGGSLTKQTLLDLMKNVAASITRGMPYRK